MKASTLLDEFIELTPSKGNNVISPDVTKVGADLNDHIIAFQAILIQKHEIDKIKSDDRVQAADFSINNASKKIQRGMKLVEYMLQERYWFLQEMRNQDEKMVHLIEELHQMTEINDLASFDQLLVETKLNTIKQTLAECQQCFLRANSSLLALDKRFLYTYQSSKDAPELFKNNLMEASNQLYILFKRRAGELQSIQDNQMDKEKEKAKDQVPEPTTAPGELSDAQVQKLIQFLESFSDQLAEQVPIQIKILCHLWIEDLIKVQGMYSRNLAMYSGFLTQFTGSFEEIIFYIRKTNQNIVQLKSDNKNSLRLLQMIQLPQLQINQNLQYHTTAQQKLYKSLENLIKIRGELNELYNRSTKVRFLVSSEAPNTDEDERPVGEFPGSIKLKALEHELLKTLKFNEVCRLSQELEFLQLETESLMRILSKVKDMWVCEKKLRKAQNHYMAAAAELKRGRAALDAVPDYNKLSSQAILDLSGIGDQVLASLRMLQKYINQLHFYLNTAKQLQSLLPIIGDFIIQVEKFLQKANLLQEQGLQAAMIDYRRVFAIVEDRRKAGAYIKIPPTPPPPPEPIIDSDQEFENRINNQGFKQRGNNNYVDDQQLFVVRPQSREPTKRLSFMHEMRDPQLVSLTDDLINNNKGNIKIENIYNQKDFDRGD